MGNLLHVRYLPARSGNVIAHGSTGTGPPLVVILGWLSSLDDVLHLLPSVQAPALVLHYRADRLISFRRALDLVTGLPDATLVPLDGRVHLPDARDLDHIEKASSTTSTGTAESGSRAG